MKILFCGDRNWTDFGKISDALRRFIFKYGEFVVIHGGARGADSLSGEIATDMGIPIQVFKADWKSYGKAAGPLRNKQMLIEGKPDLVIAFHSNLNLSKGTKDMVNRARIANIPVEIIE